jgi:hypothetical protein
LESAPTIKLKHKGKFAIQYSIGVKTKKKTGWTWKKFKIGAPYSLDFIN